MWLDECRVSPFSALTPVGLFIAEFDSNRSIIIKTIWFNKSDTNELADYNNAVYFSSWVLNVKNIFPRFSQFFRKNNFQFKLKGPHYFKALICDFRRHRVA